MCQSDSLARINAKIAAQMHAEIFDNPWSEKSFFDLFTLPPIRYIIINEGLLVYSALFDEIEIATIGILPPYQRQGKGDKLLSDLIEKAKSLNMRRILLEVAVNNAPAIALYEKKGFTLINTRKNYYKTPLGQIDANCYELVL